MSYNLCVCVFHFLLGFLVSTKKKKYCHLHSQDQCYENVCENVVIGADTAPKDYQAFECELGQTDVLWSYCMRLCYEITFSFLFPARYDLDSKSENLSKHVSNSMHLSDN